MMMILLLIFLNAMELLPTLNDTNKSEVIECNLTDKKYLTNAMVNRIYKDCQDGIPNNQIFEPDILKNNPLLKFSELLPWSNECNSAQKDFLKTLIIQKQDSIEVKSQKGIILFVLHQNNFCQKNLSEVDKLDIVLSSILSKSAYTIFSIDLIKKVKKLSLSKYMNNFNGIFLDTEGRPINRFIGPPLQPNVPN